MTEDVKNADANAPKKLSIQRRTKTTVSSTTAGGKAKAVQVEVRKKRTVPTDAARKAAEAEKLKAQQEAEKKAAEEKARLAAEKAAAEKAKAEKLRLKQKKQRNQRKVRLKINLNPLIQKKKNVKQKKQNFVVKRKNLLAKKQKSKRVKQLKKLNVMLSLTLQVMIIHQRITRIII